MRLFDAIDALPADAVYTVCAALLVALLIVERAVMQERVR